MPLWRVVSIGRYWVAMSVIGALVGATIAYGVVSVMPPAYTSRVTLMVGPPPGAANVTLNDVLVAQALVSTYAQLAVTRPVLDRAIASTHVAVSADDLAPAVSTQTAPNSGLFDISVSYEDAGQSAALANAIASEIATAPASNGPTGAATIVVTVVDPAIAAAAPDRVRLVQGIVLGAGIGLMLIVGLALLVESFPRRRGASADPSAAETSS